MSVHDEILKHGLKQGTTELLHIDNPTVINGTKCECICPYCQAPLVARKEGKGGRYRQNIHHFAHAMGYEPCGKGGTSALHILAQKVIDEEKKVMLPAYDKKFVKKAAQLITLDEVTLEETCKDEVSRRRPDCIGKVLSKGIEIWVEIYCTNPINKERRDDIIRRQQYCIEIDFSDLLGTDYTKESIRERLLNSFDDREWICHPEWDKEEAEKEEEDRIKQEAERRRLEEIEREEARKRKVIAEALRDGNIKIIQEPKVETPAPQVSWDFIKPKENNNSQTPNTLTSKDWLQDVKCIQLDAKGREGFYHMISKEYANVTFANSHRFVIEHAHEKIEQLINVINTNPDILQPETKVYLEYLMVLWVLEHLNRHREFELGKTFVENQTIRNTILQAIKQIKQVTIKLNEQSIRALPAIQVAEETEIVVRILNICYN